jgi:hypothetical protein
LFFYIKKFFDLSSHNLIIVGNGFDLAHGLKTSYEDFIKSQTNDNDLTYLLKELNKNNWNDIEYIYFDFISHLEKYNTEKVKENKGYMKKKYGLEYDDYDAFFNIKFLNDEFEKIKENLTEYLITEQGKFRFNNNYEKFFSFFENHDTVILNFNYTNTISKYTGDKQIEQIQIHGELNNPENPIIFGFACDELESKNLLKENNNEFVRNIKKFNYLFTNNEDRIKKHLQSEEFNVFILGHSCGISDKLILSQILNAKGIKNIIPFYYKDRNGYFDTMVNIDRIIDDYSKNSDKKNFSKLLSFPKCPPMPQKGDEKNTLKFDSNMILKFDPEYDLSEEEKNQVYNDEMTNNIPKNIREFN